jgi:uncharacterized membrane protein
MAEVNGIAREALKKLNVFASMPPKHAGTTMFSKARLDTLSDGIFGVAMTLLILDVRLPDDFHPKDGGELVQGLLGLWPKFLPYVLSFGVLGLRWLSNIEVRSRAVYITPLRTWSRATICASVRCRRSCRSSPRYWRSR